MENNNENFITGADFQTIQEIFRQEFSDLMREIRTLTENLSRW